MPKWNYQSKDAEILKKWKEQYIDRCCWDAELGRFADIDADDVEIFADVEVGTLYAQYEEKLLSRSELTAAQLRDGLGKEKPDGYQIPDENTANRKKQLQERLLKSHINSLCGLDVPAEDQLWRYIPEEIEIFQESDEHLMPFLEEEDKARLIDVYRNVDPMTLDRDGRPALLPEGKAVLNELTGKAVDRMIAELQPFLQKMQTPQGVSDEALLDIYGKFTQAGKLVDALLMHEDGGRVNSLSDAQYMQLIRFRRCKEAVEARVELMLSEDYLRIDTDTLYALDENGIRNLTTVLQKEQQHSSLRTMGTYLNKQLTYKKWVEGLRMQAPEGEELLPNGLTVKDYEHQNTVEQILGHSRVLSAATLTDREKMILLEGFCRTMISTAPMNAPSQYETLLKNALPEFRIITDPTEKAARKALREKAIAAMSMPYREKTHYKYGWPPEVNRLLNNCISVLDDADVELSYANIRRQQRGHEEPGDDAQRKSLYRKAGEKLLQKKDQLLQLCRDEPEQFLEHFSAMPQLVQLGASCDDLTKNAPKLFTAQEVKDIYEIESAACMAMARIAQMASPQYEIFSFKDPARMTNSEIIRMHQYATDQGSILAGDPLYYDLLLLFDAADKPYLSQISRLLEKTTAAVRAVRKNDWNGMQYASWDGGKLHEDDAMLALDRGEIVYAYCPTREAVPLFCREGLAGPMLAGDAALAAGRTAYQDRPAPMSPVPEMTAQEDPEPDIFGLSLLWDGIVYFFTSLFGEGRHTDTYQAYEKAWDAWNERDMQRKKWDQMDDEQQEAAENAYTAALTDLACVKNGEIPPAVYKKVGVEPPAPQQNRPMPMNFEEKKQELAVKMLDDIAKNEETRYRVGAELFKQLIEDPNIKSKEKDLLISAIAAQQHKIDKAEKAGQPPQPENGQPTRDPKSFVKSICFQAFPKTLGLPNDAAKVQALNKWLKEGNLAKTELGKEYARQLQQQAGNNAQQVNSAQQMNT